MQVNLSFMEGERINNPPLAIDMAKALIDISRDEVWDFHGDPGMRIEWLEEVAEHLHVYARTAHGNIIRERRRERDGN